MSGERIYRALLHLYPRAFRAEFEPFMIELFRHRRRSSTPLALWRHIAFDLAVSVPREWLRPPPLPSRGVAMTSVLQDLVFALRSSRRNWGTASLAIAVLAVGLGTSIAVFATVNGVLLRPLPYPHSERIVRLWANDTDDAVERFSFTKIEFRAYAEQNKSFEVIGGDFPIDLTLTGTDGEPERLAAAFTTPGYFEVYGASPLYGRTFTFADIDAGDPMIAVVSHGLWSRRFGADPELVGRVIQLDGRGFTVVGVLPASYRHVSSDTDVFIPYTVGTERWIGRWLELSAKLKPGVSIEQASADVHAMTAAIAEEQARTRGWSMSVESLLESTVGSTRFAMWAAFGAVLMLFALAAVNVTSLFLARAATQQHDVALRAALGAGRFERVRQTTFENLLVGSLGVAGGVWLASQLTPQLVALGAHSFPRLSSFGFDHRIVLFGTALGLTILFVLGAAPVVFAASSSGRSNMLTGRASTDILHSTARLLGGLVVAETALAVAILFGAGVLMRSYSELMKVDPGYDATQTIVMTVSVPEARYPTRRSRIAFFEELEVRMNALPGTLSAALTAYLPLGGQGALSFLNSEARVARRESRIASLQRIVSPSFFRTLQIPVLGGQSFDSRRSDDAPRQVILGASLARRLFGEEDPIGKRVTSSDTPGPDDWREVAGVVGDVRYIDLSALPEAQFYEPFDERAWSTMTIVTRTRSARDPFITSARQIVHSLDPKVPVFGIDTFGAMVRRSAARPRFNVAVFTVFASVAFTLALAGIYGVVSFVTSRRTREIGIRMAFGASCERVSRSFVRRAAGLAAIGTLLGLCIAVAASYGLRSLLYGVSPFDPLTGVVVAGVLLGAAVAASFLPARRASRIDPMTALRQE